MRSRQRGVTLVIYGWYDSQPGTLAWVFPELRAALARRTRACATPSGGSSSRARARSTARWTSSSPPCGPRAGRALAESRARRCARSIHRGHPGPRVETPSHVASAGTRGRNACENRRRGDADGAGRSGLRGAGRGRLWAGCGGGPQHGTTFNPEDAGGTDGAKVSGDAPSGSGSGGSLLGDSGGEAARLQDVLGRPARGARLRRTRRTSCTTCPADEGCGTNGQCVAGLRRRLGQQELDRPRLLHDPRRRLEQHPDQPGGRARGRQRRQLLRGIRHEQLGHADDGEPRLRRASRSTPSPYAYVPQGSGDEHHLPPIPSTGIPAGQMAIVFLAQYGTIRGRHVQGALPERRDRRDHVGGRGAPRHGDGHRHPPDDERARCRLRHLSVWRRCLVHLERDAAPPDGRVGRELRRYRGLGGATDARGARRRGCRWTSRSSACRTTHR